MSFGTQTETIGLLRDLWIAELAERTIESPHDRTHIKRRLMALREKLEAEPALDSEEEVYENQEAGQE